MKRLLAGIVVSSLVLGFSLATLAWSIYAYSVLAGYETLYAKVSGVVSLNASTVKRLLRAYREALRLRPLVANASRMLSEVNVSRLEALVSEAKRLLYSPEVDALEELLRFASGFSAEARKALRMIQEARRLVSEAQAAIEELRGFNVSLLRDASSLLRELNETLPPQKLEKIALLLEELNGGGFGETLEADKRVLEVVAGVSAASSVASAAILALMLRRARPGASR